MDAVNPELDDEALELSAPQHEKFMLMKPDKWGGRRLAKTLTASAEGFTSSKDAYHPTWFTRRAVQFSDIESLFAQLRDADRGGENFSYGLPASAEIGARPEPIRRKSDQVVTPAKTIILLSDIENTPAMNVDSLIGVSAEKIWKHLCDSKCVADFQIGADVIVHFSASHGSDGSLAPRIHAFQLLDRPVSIEWLSVLAGDLKIEEVSVDAEKSVTKHGCLDTSVLEKDRALWGSPVIGKGLKEDPVGERWFLIKSDRPYVAVPSVDKLMELARAQDQRAIALGAVGSKRRQKAPGAANDVGPEVSDRDWQTGGGWRGVFEDLRQSRGNPLWLTVRRYCGKAIRAHGDDAAVREQFIGEVRHFLRTEVIHYDRSESRAARVEAVASGLPILWRDVAIQHDWQVTPRLERKLFPSSNTDIAKARTQLGNYVDNILDDLITRMQKADRVALAIAQVRDGQAAAALLQEKSAAQIAKAVEASKLAQDARKEKQHTDSEKELRRASGLRRAAERLSKRADDLKRRSEKFGRRTGVLAPLAAPGPDGETFELISPPARASGTWAIAPSVGVGKTHAIVERTEKVALAGARMLVASGTQVLSQAYEDRLGALSGGLLPFKLESYRGENQPDPVNPGRTMCPRAEERTKLRLAGIEANLLCGSKAHPCPFKPLKKRPADAPPACQWWLQQEKLADADVVVTNAGPMLAAEAPAFMRRRLKSFTKFDWVQGRPRTIHIERDDFDLVVLDEPYFERLEEVEAAPTKDDAEPEAVTYPLDLLGAADILAGPRPEVRPGWRHGVGPEGQDEDGGHKALAEILAALAPATDILRAAAANHGKTYGYLTYGALHQALGAETPAFVRRDKAAELANLAFRALQAPKDLAGDQPASAWLSSPAGQATAEWNKKLMFLHRLWSSVAKALDRSQNAEDGRPNAFVKRVDVPAGRGRPWRPALAARTVKTLHKSLRKAPVIILDAAYREDLAGPHLGAIAKPALRLHVPPAPGSCHVTVATDSTFSYTRLRDGIKGRLVPQIARWAERGAARNAGRGGDDGVDGLLVVPMELEDALDAWWKVNGGIPDGLDMVHYGALRGLDHWREVAWLGAVGRMLAPLQASVDRANLLTGEVDQSPPRDFTRDLGSFEARQDGWEWTLKGAWPRLPDPVAEACRASACDDELVQAVGRLRLAQRPGAGVQIEILTNHPIAGLPVDRFVKGVDLLGAGDPSTQVACLGFGPEGARGARRPKGIQSWEALAAGEPLERLKTRKRGRRT